jgi:hypothetical protein
MASRCLAGWTVFVLCATVSVAAAQGPERKWEIEVHAGGMTGNQPDTGTPIGEFARGNPIPTGGGTFTSRAVSSWYFGDGSALFNQVATPIITARVTPLDAALRGPIARREDGAVFGARVTRHLSGRLAAEFSLDYGQSSLRLSNDAAAGIEVTRASFETAWRTFLTGFTRTVTSNAQVESGDGHQLATSGVVRIRVGGTPRFAPFVAGGLGGIFRSGALPSATLIGNYNFSAAGAFTINETDTVTIRAVREDKSIVGILGGGFTYDVTARHGMRVDARMHVGGSPVNTVVDARPSVVMGANTVLALNTSGGSLQFSTSPVLNRPSSLSGPTIDGLETFSGSGRSRQFTVAIGYFLRF